MTSYIGYNIIDIQGTVPIAGAVLYSAPIGRTGNIDNIKINNPNIVAYTISLYKRIGASSVLLYTFDLDAGDVLSDSSHYIFDAETEIYGTSSDDDVTFIITGNEIDLNIAV